MTNINKESVLTQELVNRLFNYKDGFLYWKIRKAMCIQIGDVVGCAQKSGRKVITLNYTTYYSSRIIFLWHNGYMPLIVDHEDRDCTNDKIENLRDADYAKNNKNTTSRKNTSSKYLGVYFSKDVGKWRAAITLDGKTLTAGSFELESDAALSYNRVAVKYHGEFANLNIID